jgi:spermidine synthase
MEGFDVPLLHGGALRVDGRQLHRERSRYQDIQVYETAAFGRCLLLDGVIQIAESDHQIYDQAMLTPLRPTDRELLILGSGDGYIAERALAQNPDVRVTMVEIDSAVIATARDWLGQEVFADPRLELIEDDVFAWLPQVRERKFDGLICDLTDFPLGQDQESLRAFYQDIFFRVDAVLNERGWISIYAGVKGAVLASSEGVVMFMQQLVRQNFATVDTCEAFVPSFCEPCCFVYGLR